jgi:serine/threonine-protein phosphatase 4 regulatory subunit 4
VQLVSAALPLFSCRWVKEHLLEGVLGLLSDAVPNVRLAALGLLPALKQTIRLPEDVERLVRESQDSCYNCGLL